MIALLHEYGRETGSQALALARPFYKAGNIDKFEDGGDDLGRLTHLRKHVEAVVGHRNHSSIGLDRTETIICGQCFARLCDSVEQRAFSDVRQADDSSS